MIFVDLAANDAIFVDAKTRVLMSNSIHEWI
jgi:hypothetical protein